MIVFTMSSLVISNMTFFQGTVSAVSYVLVDGFCVYLSAVFQNDSCLMLVERDLFLFRIVYTVSVVYKSFYDFITYYGFFYDLFTVFQFDLEVEKLWLVLS